MYSTRMVWQRAIWDAGGWHQRAYAFGTDTTRGFEGIRPHLTSQGERERDGRRRRERELSSQEFLNAPIIIKWRMIRCKLGCPISLQDALIHIHG